MDFFYDWNFYGFIANEDVFHNIYVYINKFSITEPFPKYHHISNRRDGIFSHSSQPTTVPSSKPFMSDSQSISGANADYNKATMTPN